jgi:hypothetical protein
VSRYHEGERPAGRLRTDGADFVRQRGWIPFVALTYRRRRQQHRQVRTEFADERRLARLTRAQQQHALAAGKVPGEDRLELARNAHTSV